MRVGGARENQRTVSRCPVLVCVILLAFAAAALALWSVDGRFLALWHGFLQILEHREAIRSFVLSFEALAPIAFLGVQALQVMLSPIPGEATGFLGGFLFGVGAGFFYSTVGLTFGSAGAFFLSRQFRRLVRSRLGDSRTYARFNHVVEHQGLFVSLVLFLLPGFPKDFLCYLLGLSRMPWQAFLAVVTLGRMPGTLLLTLQGAEVYEGDYAGFLGVLLFTLTVSGPAWYYREAIYAWVERHQLKE